MKAAKPVLIGLLLIGILASRLLFLDADPSRGLSFSTGIYTDEGYYSLDAVNVANHRHWAPGDFHSAVLSPLLHVLQLAVFRLAGARLEAARMISVLGNLGAILLFALAMRLFYGRRAAWLSVAFLGLSWPAVQYARLALMEAPTSILLCAAFYMTALAMARERGNVGSGIAMGFAMVVKSLAAPAALGMLAPLWRRAPRLFWGGLLGMGAVATAYGLLWYLPHRTELAHSGRFYLLHQALPHTLVGLARNVKRGLVTGQADGVLPWMLFADPVLVLLAVGGMALAWRRRQNADLILTCWAIAPIGTSLFLSYTPSRYDMLFWPAIAGLAAIAVDSLSKRSIMAVAGLFLAINVGRLTANAIGRAYTVRDASANLARSLPSGSVLAGQFAPELAIAGRFESMPVEPRLANDADPVGSGATHVLVTRVPYWERWWKQRYPNVIVASHRVASVTMGDNLVVDVYQVRMAARVGDLNAH